MEFFNEFFAFQAITWDEISMQSPIFMDVWSLNIFSLL